MTLSLELRTVQSGAFKIMTEALKDILTDTSIEFDPEIGMKLVSMDGGHSVLVHLHLEASKFEYFYCRERVCIGVNMMQFHKLIKTIVNNDTLTLFLESDDPNHLGIKIEKEGQKTSFKLNLLDLDHAKITIDPVSFSSVITLPSPDLHKVCRDMVSIADAVTVTNVKNQLIFSCKGDFCSQTTVMTDNDNNSNSIQPADGTPEDEITQGVFSLKFLTLFTKCTNLSNTVSLHLRSDYPLIVVYQVASLGSIKLALAPQADTD